MRLLGASALRASDTCHSSSPRQRACLRPSPLQMETDRCPSPCPTTHGKHLTSSPFKVKLCDLGQVTLPLWAALFAFINRPYRCNQPHGSSGWSLKTIHRGWWVIPIIQMWKLRLREKEATCPRSGSTLRAQQRMWVSTGHRCFLPRAEARASQKGGTVTLSWPCSSLPPSSPSPFLRPPNKAAFIQTVAAFLSDT